MAIVLCQAGALVILALILVVKTVFGSPTRTGGAVSTAGLVLVGAAMLALCARGLLRAARAALAPAVVIEVLAVAVGFSLGVQAGRIGYGGPMLVSALAVLVLLFLPTSRRTLGMDG